MKNIKLVITSAFAVSIIFCSCGNKEQKDEQANDTAAVAAVDTTPVNDLADYQFKATISNLPPLIKVLDEFAKSNLPINLGLLNPAENANNYHSSLKQAFNYGIYGVDMGYLVVNSRTLESIKYYESTKMLAGNLNMSETFNRYVSRFQNNSNNKDSLTRVINEIYETTDAYLRSNERLETASEILAGSWIECQHITLELLKNSERTPENENLYNRVWEQRLFLENITKILAAFKDNEELAKINKDFENLLLIYKQPHSSADISKELLQKLSKNLGMIRANIIN